MARPIRTGLDYFPMDVDFFSDIRIRKLIRYQGGKAIAVYALLLCIIYKEGYYIRWDDDLPFIISEQTGYEEAYIREVIKLCLSIGLFSRELYDSEKIMTSRGIQSRYLSCVEGTNRRIREIEEFSLVSSDKTPIKSDKTPIKSDKTPIKSDKTPIKSDKTPQSKVKEKKENKRNSPHSPPEGDERADARCGKDFLNKILTQISPEALTRQIDELALSRERFEDLALTILREWEDFNEPDRNIRHLFNQVRRKAAATPRAKNAPTKAAIQQARREKEERRQKAAEEERAYRESVEKTGLNGAQQYCVQMGLPKDTSLKELVTTTQSEQAALREFRERMNNNS